MRVALLQIASPDDETVQDRLARIDAVVRAETGLADVDLLVLPELWAAGAFRYEQFAPSAEPFDGASLALARRWASEYGIHVHPGSFVEDDGGLLYNTSVVVRPEGEVVLKYRKVHLFGKNEAAALTPGDRVDVAAVDRLSVGLATCYDLRFPELFRSIVDAGATTTLIASGWPTARIAHWRLFTSARAVEDQMYVIGCNAVGVQSGVELGGRSRVVDPWGEVVVEAGTEEGFTYADVDPDLPATVRSRFAALADRRWT
jgi:predicted amidohydrolase